MGYKRIAHGMEVYQCGTLPIVTCLCGQEVGLYDIMGFGGSCDKCGQWYRPSCEPYDGPSLEDLRRDWERHKTNLMEEIDRGQKRYAAAIAKYPDVERAALNDLPI